jgi:DNA-binding protein H-NS
MKMASLEEIKKQIAELQKQADAIVSQEREKIIAEIKQKLADFNILASDLGLSKKSGKKKLGSSTATEPVIKYKNEAGDTWSGGRGRQPEWIKAIKAAGGDIEKYRVAE